MKPCQNAVEAQLKNYTEDIHILPSLYQPEGEVCTVGLRSRWVAG